MWKKRKNEFMNELIIMTCGMITPIQLQKRMNRVANTRSQMTTVFLNSPKQNIMGDQKQDS